MTKKTLKLPIFLLKEEKEIVLKYQRNQNNVIRFTYNRLLENPDLSTAEISAMQDGMVNEHVRKATGMDPCITDCQMRAYKYWNRVNDTVD